MSIPEDDLSSGRQKLGRRVENQAARMRQAEKERRTLLAHSVYIGVLGLLFVLPVVAGAYLGRWLDGFASGYSMRWTLSLIFVGVVVGAINVYLFIRE